MIKSLACLERVQKSNKTNERNMLAQQRLGDVAMFQPRAEPKRT
jgi:hypothetical protein